MKIRMITTLLISAVLIAGCQAGGDREGVSTPTPTPTETIGPDGDEETNDDADMATVADPLVLDNWAYPARYSELAQEFDYELQEFAQQEFPVFQIGSLLPGTLYPDSVRPPLASKSVEEIIARVLGEPDYCAQTAVGLYDTPFVTPGGDSISVRDENLWLARWFPTNIADVDEWAVEAVSGDLGQQLQSAKKCALVAALLEQLHDGGVLNLATSMNFHIAVEDSLAVNASNPFLSVREFELNPLQYAGEFVVLEFRLKGQPSLCINQILFNTQDGRFARPECETTSTPPPTTTPDCVRNVDDECVVSKPAGGPGTFPTGAPPASPTAPQTAPPEVVTVLPDDDTTDESEESDGEITDD